MRDDLFVRCPPKLAAVDAFFAAARGDDLEALIAVLDPDVVLRSDGGALAEPPTPGTARASPSPAAAVLLILLASGGSQPRA
jgi:hypothetical protein